jgi:uncharacterized protein
MSMKTLFAISEKDLLLYWLSFVSLIALICMGVDKASSKMRKKRISEATFWILSAFGGFPGVFLGALFFHHKTSKPSFWLPIVIPTILWLLLIFVIFELIRI